MRPAPRRIDIAAVLLPEPVVEGLSLKKIARQASWLRSIPHHELKPIEVREEGVHHQRGTLYSLTNGRHRFISYIAAGRTTILAEVEEEEETE